MRIVIDARNAHGSGIYRYSYHLVEELQTLDMDREYVVLLGRGAFGGWRLESPNFRSHLADQAIYSAGEQSSLLGTLVRLHPDLVHFTSFNAPLLYRGRRVTTVHDLTYLEFPSIRDASLLGRLRYATRDAAMRAVLRTSLRRSAAVITDTHYVREELLRRYGGGRRPVLAAERTFAIHCGAGDRGAAPAEGDTAAPDTLPAGVHPPYLLYVGHAYPHKNLRLLVDGFRLLRRVHRDLRLVIVGPQDSFYEALRDYAGDEREIVFPGYVSDAELASLYRQARLFVLPSLSEGFGLPALEAMSHGTPVLAAEASCLPEVCGDAAAYFDPRDPRDLARKAAGLLRADEERERLRQAGSRHTTQFSWRRMAERTLAVYESVLGART